MSTTRAIKATKSTARIVSEMPGKSLCVSLASISTVPPLFLRQPQGCATNSIDDVLSFSISKPKQCNKSGSHASSPRLKRS